MTDHLESPMGTYRRQQEKRAAELLRRARQAAELEGGGADRGPPTGMDCPTQQDQPLDPADGDEAGHCEQT